VVEPYASGLGGGGLWLLHRAADGYQVMVDARETAPAGAKPELYDVFSTAFTFVPEPTVSPQVLCDWPGWWCNPEKDALLLAMGREFDLKKRQAVWEKIQTIFYADAARMKVGDYFRLDARRKDVQGYEPGPYMHFWNVWLERR